VPRSAASMSFTDVPMVVSDVTAGIVRRVRGNHVEIANGPRKFSALGKSRFPALSCGPIRRAQTSGTNTCLGIRSREINKVWPSDLPKPTPLFSRCRQTFTIRRNC
jgi:hypothetical protein